MEKRAYTQLVNKQRNLPRQLERAYNRVRHLRAECVRYGMHKLLEDPKFASDAFEREFAAAKAQNKEGQQ